MAATAVLALQPLGMAKHRVVEAEDVRVRFKETAVKVEMVSV